MQSSALNPSGNLVNSGSNHCKTPSNSSVTLLGAEQDAGWNRQAFMRDHRNKKPGRAVLSPQA